MSAYFGNGYLLNILQRGAMPVGNGLANPTPAPVQVEETVATTSNQSEVSSPTLAVQSESLEHPVNAFTQPPKNDPQIETAGFEGPTVTTRFESRDIPFETTTLPTPDTQDQEAKAISRSNDALAASESPLAQVSSSSPTDLRVDTEPLVAQPPVIEPAPQRQPASGVFELRMPENFFGHAKGETSSTEQLKPVVVSTAPGAPAENQPTVDHSSESVVRAKTHADAPSQVNAVIIPKHRDAAVEPQTSDLTPPDSIADARESVVSEVTDQVKPTIVQPPRLIPAPSFEAPVPRPAVEHTSEYLQFRQPALTPPRVAPPARMQINRLDIQVVNQVQAPPAPPPAPVPEVSQLLEKHLGRVELLL